MAKNLTLIRFHAGETKSGASLFINPNHVMAVAGSQLYPKQCYVKLQNGTDVELNLPAEVVSDRLSHTK